MPPANQQVRDAFAGRLVSMTEVADSAVKTGYVYDFTSVDLPGINVTTPEEAVLEGEDDEGTLGGLVGKALTIAVEIFVKQSDDAHLDKADAIDSEVYQKVYAGADFFLGGLVSQLDPFGKETETSGEEEKPVVKKTLFFRATYKTLLHDPDTITA